MSNKIQKSITLEAETKAIVFIDIRNFTLASERADFVKIMQKFISSYYDIIQQEFPDSFIKFLGDGAMILCDELGITNILDRCTNIRKEFHSLLNQYKGIGLDLNLELGFGVSSASNPSEIDYKLSNKHISLLDYLHTRINMASRLCSLARPHGIIIHQESFSELDEKYVSNFASKQFKGIKGFDSKNELRCWVENTIEDDKLPVTEVITLNNEVHITGLCFYEGKLVLWKRADSRNIAPAKWAGPGGKIQGKKSFVEELDSKIWEEVNLKVKNESLLDTYFIEDQKIPGIIYYCEIDSEDSDFINANCKSFTLNEIKKNENILPDKDIIKKAFDKNRTYSNNSISTKIRIQIDQACNYNCVICHKDNVRDIINESNIQNQVNSYISLKKIFNIDSLTITGGEPFKNNDLWTLISKIKEIDSSVSIKLVTNASLINDKAIDKIVEHGVDVKISIYGYLDSTAQKITRITQENYFLNITSIIRKLNKREVQVTVNILMNSLIKDEIPHIVEYIKAEFSDEVNIKIIEMVKPFENEGIQLFAPLKNSFHDIYQYECCTGRCELCFDKWGPIILPNGELQLCENTPNTIKQILSKKEIIKINYVNYKENILISN